MAVKIIGKTPFSSSQFSPLQASDIPAGVKSGTVHIQTLNITGVNSFNFKSIPNKYSSLIVLIDGWSSNATAVEIDMQINLDTGLFYDYTRLEIDSTPAVLTASSGGLLRIMQTNAASVGSSWNQKASGKIEIFLPESGRPYLVSWVGGNSARLYQGSGRYNSVLPISSITFTSSGTIDGRFSLYGTLKQTDV